MLRALRSSPNPDKPKIRCTCGAYDNYFDNKAELQSVIPLLLTA